MAFCINCGQELAEGAKFCANCGTSIGKSGRTQRETVYEGNLHKCPNCGELINAFVLNCPTCGHEIRDAENSSSVKELTSKLENVEEKRENEKIKSSYMSLMMGDAWKVQKTDEQKINLIRSFPIPNTKEDLLEFMILASSNIDMQVYGTDSNNINTFQPARRQISDAWLAKFEQAFNKAQIMFGTSQEFALLKQVHDNKMAEIKKDKTAITANDGRLVWRFNTDAITVLYLNIFLIVIIKAIKELYEILIKTIEQAALWMKFVAASLHI